MAWISSGFKSKEENFIIFVLLVAGINNGRSCRLKYTKAVWARLPDGFVKIAVFNPVISPSDIAISAGSCIMSPSHTACFKTNQSFLWFGIVRVCNTFVKPSYLFYFLFPGPHTRPALNRAFEEPRSKLRRMFCRTAEPTGNALAVAVQVCEISEFTLTLR